MLAFSGIDKGRKPNKYWYKACRVITETKGNGGLRLIMSKSSSDNIDVGERCWRREALLTKLGSFFSGEISIFG